MTLHDNYGRQVSYLRVSITDRCNLRCFYCLPKSCGIPARSSALTLDEIAAIVRVGVGLGITKIRITGGEPLVHPGLGGFVRELAAMPRIADLALSTNGTLLADHAAELRDAGLRRVNVSLDSLRPAVFRAVSGRNDLSRVVAGIDAAVAAGLRPVKLNVVVMRGVNDDELPSIVDFAARHGAQTRFIEYMPLGIGERWASSYVPRAEILERLDPLLSSRPPRRQPGDTASYYELAGGGEVGVISPVSCRFCDLCNRLRLTSDGKLRPCLTGDGEVDLRDALRPSLREDALEEAFRLATAGRPATGSYAHASDRDTGAAPRSMSQIGG